LPPEIGVVLCRGQAAALIVPVVAENPPVFVMEVGRATSGALVSVHVVGGVSATGRALRAWRYDALRKSAVKVQKASEKSRSDEIENAAKVFSV
jgi:hypothetical protein